MDHLSKIALKYDTDKGLNHHQYTPIYDKYFFPLTKNKIKFLEIGFGGYEYFDRGGGSAKMWREYFHKDSQVIITDIYDKYCIPGVIFYNTSNINIKDIAKNCDVILDDGSHINGEIVETFEILFPLLNEQGFYVIEDLETSYWPDHGYGGHPDPNQNIQTTAMSYFLKLAHQLNYSSFSTQYHHSFSNNLDFIHFYKNLIIIKKK